MRRCSLSAFTVLLLALTLAACGGSSTDTSGSGSGSSTTEYTKVTNDAAGEFAAINDDIAKAAGGGQADSAATWTGLADRLDVLSKRLKSTKAPTSESRAPLAALTDHVAKLGSDARAIAGAGGAQSAGARLLGALTDDSEAVQSDLQKLPLY